MATAAGHKQSNCDESEHCARGQRRYQAGFEWEEEVEGIPHPLPSTAPSINWVIAPTAAVNGLWASTKCDWGLPVKRSAASDFNEIVRQRRQRSAACRVCLRCGAAKRRPFALSRTALIYCRVRPHIAEICECRACAGMGARVAGESTGLSPAPQYVCLGNCRAVCAVTRVRHSLQRRPQDRAASAKINYVTQMGGNPLLEWYY